MEPNLYFINGRIYYKNEVGEFIQLNISGGGVGGIGRSSVISLINQFGGNTFEDGTFTLNAAGTVATGGVLSGPAATPTLTITTTKKLKLWFGQVFDINFPGVAPEVFSDGQSDGVIQFSSRFTPPDVFASSTCIAVGGGANPDGWNGQILAAGITSTSYDITFQKLGVGLDILGKYNAITK